MFTEIYDLNDDKIYDFAMSRAAEIINGDGIVVFPTETVYGLGANALSVQAVGKIFKAKGRPSDNPLIVHLSDVNEIESVACEVTQSASIIAKKFMPGPITIILKKKSVIPDVVSAGLDSVGVRVPSLQSARDFIGRCGVAIAAPSANISGRPSPTLSAHVLADMNGRADAILLEDNARIGLESTVVDCTSEPVRILRPGLISFEDLSEIVDVIIQDDIKIGQAPHSPGMKYRHYKPKAKVIAVNADIFAARRYILERITDSDAALVFDEAKDKIDAKHVFSLGQISDPQYAASKLFAYFRACDELGVRMIYSMVPPNTGVGRAFNNRLFKAADEIVKQSDIIDCEELT